MTLVRCGDLGIGSPKNLDPFLVERFRLVFLFRFLGVSSRSESGANPSRVPCVIYIWLNFSRTLRHASTGEC